MTYDIRKCPEHPYAAHRVLGFADSDQAAEVECLKCHTTIPQGPLEDDIMNAAVIFGDPWDAPVCEGATIIATPIGQPCGLCDEALVAGDSGMMQNFVTAEDAGWRPVHKECQFRAVVGGWGHHENHPYWCNLMHDTDGGLSRRESSLKVWEYFGGPQ
jgi:hypothetical protein